MSGERKRRVLLLSDWSVVICWWLEVVGGVVSCFIRVTFLRQARPQCPVINMGSSLQGGRVQSIRRTSSLDGLRRESTCACYRLRVRMYGAPSR